MPLLKIPSVIPGKYTPNAGVVVTPDVDTGGYDFTIGGHGFRLASDQQFPYQRYTEPTTVRRFDDSAEPGEQTLSDLPWIKSQSSFHAGAGQLNLEQGFTSFQYQQEQVEHIRFDNCLGVDVWTPGQVTRLPDCHLTEWSDGTFTPTCVVTASVDSVDYAIVGGAGALYQVVWSDPDTDPTITQITLDVSTYGASSNYKITSLATDGSRYFGVVQLTAVGYVSGVLTYIVSGDINSTASPTALYECPSQTDLPSRTNLCTNPDFESGTTGWAAAGSPAPTIAQSTAQHHSGTHSLKVTSGGAATFLPNAKFALTTVSGTTYTLSGYVYLEAGCPSVFATAGSAFGTGAATTGAWTRVSVTFTATGTSTNVGFECNFTNGTQAFYVDDVLIEETSMTGDYFDGGTTDTDDYTYAWTGTADASTSTATPTQSPLQVTSVVGWSKQRLMAGVAESVYELTVTGTDPHTALPTATYTYPSTGWVWTSVAESPNGVLMSGEQGGQSSIIQFSLDTSTATPTLGGGANVAVLPPGELVRTLVSYLGAFLAVGTTTGCRIGTFDTYTGNLKLGPVSLVTTDPVLAAVGRDRFIYCGYTNQQADGQTGVARIDTTMIVDASGRNAYAPDLRPPTTATTGLGDVVGVGVLPFNNRVLFVTPEGLHVEGDGPGTDGDSWLRTSRIRYDTAEPKLFTLGRIHGALDVANIKVSAELPFGDAKNLGTFGFIVGTDAFAQFALPGTLAEWIQMKFDLIGSACVLNSYQTKAMPSPQRQNIIVLTANCFSKETDRSGMDVTDPERPRQRYQNVKDLESAGGQVKLTEFTNSGSESVQVTIDQIQFQSFSRPNIEDDFGGYVTFKMREIG